LAELLRTKLQLVSLEDRIVGRSLSELFVVDRSRVISAVVQVETLTARIDTDNSLLRLQVFQLHPSIFIRRSVECILVGDTVQRPAGLGLFTGLEKLIGLLQELGGMLCLDLSLAADFRQVRVTVIISLTGLPYQFEIAVVVGQLEALRGDDVPLDVFQRYIQFGAAKLQLTQAIAGHRIDKTHFCRAVVDARQNVELPSIRTASLADSMSSSPKEPFFCDLVTALPPMPLPTSEARSPRRG